MKMKSLEVKLFGAFTITYQKQPLSLGKTSSTKVIRLLQILFGHLEDGITRDRLLEALYGREELTDAANNLRVTVHRLKKLLVNAGLPEYEYVKIKKGVYQWDAPFEIEVDALEMERLIETAKDEIDEEQQIRLLEKACRLYAGDYLESMSGEDWVVMEEIRYKTLYSDALHRVCEWKIAHEEYEDVLRLCTFACDLYPFDDWQSVKIDCYIAMNRYKDAILEYEQTAHMLVEELGVSPSRRMMEQFEMMSSHVQNQLQDINKIQDGLKEDNWEKGAFFCTVPGFRDAYRLMCRCMERNGQSIFLLVCTLQSSKNRQLDNRERLGQMSDALYDAIKNGLRRSDSFTKYNQAQYLAMLVGTNEEDCQIVIDRIRQNFSKDHKSWEQYLECSVSSLLDYQAAGVAGLLSRK